MPDVNEFLNPKSMLTPGFAGAATMVITNTIHSQFALQDSERAPTALVLSLLFGALVFVAEGIPKWQRVIYYVLNSLIIFSMATGSNSAGTGISARVGSLIAPAPMAAYAGVPAAYAETPRNNESVLSRRLETRPREQSVAQFFKPWFRPQAAPQKICRVIFHSNDSDPLNFDYPMDSQAGTQQCAAFAQKYLAAGATDVRVGCRPAQGPDRHGEQRFAITPGHGYDPNLSAAGPPFGPDPNCGWN
jgi:hypothetical protein